MLTHLLYVIKHIELFLFRHIVILTHCLHVMSQTYIVIFLPNYIVVLLTKSIHVTVNSISIQQNAI